MQSYNYRLCLTNNPANRVAFTKPARYNREDYASIVEDVWTGRNTDAAMQRVTPEMMEENGNISRPATLPNFRETNGGSPRSPTSSMSRT